MFAMSIPQNIVKVLVNQLQSTITILPRLGHPRALHIPSTLPPRLAKDANRDSTPYTPIHNTETEYDCQALPCPGRET